MKNNLVLKVVMGALIIVVAGLAVKLTMTKPTVQTNVTQTTTTVTVATAENTSTTKSTFVVPNGWKIYQSKESGFEIAYPSSWESPIDGWTGWTAGTSLDANNYCIVDIMRSPTEAAPTEWPQSEISDLVKKGYTKTNINIDGLSSIRLSANPARAGLAESVYIPSNGYTVRIGRNRGAESKIETECINNFNQMINTFRFLP